MTFRLEHRLGIQAPSDAIWEVLADLSGWKTWNPVYVDAVGSIGIGQSLMLTERLPGGRGERQISPTIVDWVPREQLLWSCVLVPMLSKSMRYLEIEELAPGSCIFANGEVFSGVLGERQAQRDRKLLRASYQAFGEALRDAVEKR